MNKTTLPTLLSLSEPWFSRALAAALLLLTLACFWPVGSLGFIGYDDLDYVYQNPHVQAGLTGDSVIWACTAIYDGNWHPLTWLSHMVDCEMFGLNPGAAHWVNLGFHLVNTLLLFGWLRELTGSRWRSLLVAALFAVHPLHVQSVAWIAERKDVLSGFFCLLTLRAYTCYCRQKTARDYFLVVVFFALGLMAKPMLVTLPVILLLLDFWPLHRLPIFDFRFSLLKPLLLEKWPLILLSLASCVITLWAQQSANAMTSLQALPLLDRCAHAAVAYWLYLGKLFWPVNLAILYPMNPAGPSSTAAAGAAAALMLVSLVFFWWLRTKPYLLIGWVWFGIMLLPVIGLVQIGAQSMADRYTYLPALGIFILVAWGLAEVSAISGLWRGMMTGLSLAVVLACGMDTRHQLAYWRGNVALFQHVVDVTPENNPLGNFYLGISHAEQGDLAAAAWCLSNSLAMAPNFDLARSRLGNVLLVQKKYAEAEFHLQPVARAHPADLSVRVALGLALAGQAKYLAAQAEFQAAQQLNPTDAAINGLLAANTRKAEMEQSLNELTDSLKASSTAGAYLQIAAAETALGRPAAAVLSYKSVLAREPDSLEALNNLAWILATCPDDGVRNGPEAVKLAERACEQAKFQKAIYLGTLAAAYAEAGRFDEAVATAQEAEVLAAKQGEEVMRQRNEELKRLYQSHQPFHQLNN
jgi:hypothetical protein